MRVDRFISEYARRPNAPQRRIQFVQEPSLSFLQQLLGAAADDLLYEEIQLDPEQIAKLAPLLTRQPDTTTYEYVLSCEQAD